MIYKAGDKYKIGTNGTQLFDTYKDAVAELKKRRFDNLKNALKKVKGL